MLPATSGARRPRRLRALLPACLGLLIIPIWGCGERTVEVSVQQPIAFPHQTHLEYFSSGRHPQDGIEVHKAALGLEDADVPPEMKEGKCLGECHGANLPEKTACVGCHLTFAADETLRNNKEVRRCVACHRGTWVGSAARIPAVAVCVNCHRPETTTTIANADAETKLQADLARTEDIPWVQLNAMAPDVYFSHRAHVRFQGMTCTTCHADVTTLTAPPTTARVFAMNACLKCHVDNQASTDCLTCHK